MTALDELVDKEAIREVLATYASALDFQNWPALERCFTTDAVYDIHDYFARLGLDVEPVRGRDKIVGGLQAAAATRESRLQHFFTNTVIRLDGDRAEASSYLMVHTSGRDASFSTGAVWEDRLLRTSEGWRIHHRYLRFVWADGSAEVVLAPVRASVRPDA
jgi:3-phenylpropionate/cinnamic acid dioxygenase small subunit